MHFLIEDLQAMQTINDLSSSQICALAIYQSCFTDKATAIHNRQGEVTSMPECVEIWAQALTKAHRESGLSLLLWLLLLHSSATCFLVSCSGGSFFCSFAGEVNKASHQHGHSCSFTLCHSPNLSSNANPAWMLSAIILTCACAVGRAKGIFVSLLFASFFFFLSFCF